MGVKESMACAECAEIQYTHIQNCYEVQIEYRTCKGEKIHGISYVLNLRY